MYYIAGAVCSCKFRSSRIGSSAVKTHSTTNCLVYIYVNKFKIFLFLLSKYVGLAYTVTR
jgi:hypothetical protein